MKYDLSKGTVVSTRVRLARNIEGYVFPAKLDFRRSREIIRKVTTGLGKLDNFNLYYMSEISEEEGLRLVENHLISPDLKKNDKGAALINNEEFLSIMINEEDHLREQCIVNGLDLNLAYSTMSDIDSKLGKSVEFAYDDQFGYLTACPTNLGTGLRASVMLFLPALTMTGRINDIIRSAQAIGLTVRGMYGEGSKAEGYMYQISNERTLGLTEEDILEMVKSSVERVIDYEIEDREAILSGPSAIQIKDKCLRSYGIVTNCAMISSDEFQNMCTNVKLGACLGFIPIDDVSQLDSLIVKMKPSNIIAAAQRNLSSLERDEYRAEQGAKKIKSMINK